MTDQELAQEVANRINAAEAAAEAAGDNKRLAALKKAHRDLDKAWAKLMPAMDFAPLSGSPLKP